MNGIMSGWYSELNDLCTGYCVSLEVEKVLHKEKTPYQEIVIFQSKTYGKVLVLDGIMQFTEKDEFSYQEMIAHLPMFSHPNPKSVLIVGGGDGGAVREVLKHPGVEEIHLCEIDERVIELSKLHFPDMSSGFLSPKVTVHIQDGVDFLDNYMEHFDVIITDCSDPVGPSIRLYENLFFEKVKRSLKPDGLFCCQGQSVWFEFDINLIKTCLTFCRSLFPVVKYSYVSVPTYSSGQIGFFLASKNKKTIFEEPKRQVTEEEMKKMNLNYYSPAIHRASFILPRFAQLAGID